MASKTNVAGYSNDRRRDATDAVIVHPPEVSGDSVMVEVEVAGTRHRIRARAPGAQVSSQPDAFMPVALLAAMRLGLPLRVRGRVSPRLLRGLDSIQWMLHAWERQLSRVPIEAPPREAAPARDRGAATFFSAGVDSSYTALKHLDELSALIYVPSFNPVSENPEILDRVVAGVRRASEDLGVPLLEVDTDLREFMDLFVPWDVSLGACLASVALLLAPAFHTVHMAAGQWFTTLHPWGTNPLLDPLWSSDEVTVTSDGWDATRLTKTAFIAEQGTPLAWLRVCLGDYNCGRCEKCLRTMIHLRLVGALERCRTLPSEIDLDRVARLYIQRRWMDVGSWEDALPFARDAGDKALARAVTKALRGGTLFRRIWRRLRRSRLDTDMPMPEVTSPAQGTGR